MAIVYRGEDLRHNRPVAIKCMSTDAELERERFRRETALVAQLQHPHIVPLLDSGEIDGRPYFVMPLIEGESLRHRLRRQGQLSRDEVLDITRDVSSALDYAHARGVVHRDIKPENILLATGGAVVADFGIAALAQSDARHLTETGVVIGTPAYMSPEQATADRALDGRSDIYSLACVVYESLAGHAPFTGASAREIISRQLTDEVPPLHAARPDLPPAIDRALQAALAKTPVDRPATATSFFQALVAVESHGRPKATKWLVGVGAMLVVVLVVAALVVRSLSASADFQRRDWLLIASVDNRTGDSLLGDDLGGALAVALEQSRFANVVPRQDVANTLRAMQRADTSRLIPAIAREIAERLNVRAIVFPAIRRDSTEFVVSLRVEATRTQRDLARESASASSRQGILLTLGQVAERVRSDLGERLDDEPAQTPLEFATTSSLEALRAWSEGLRHFEAGRYDAAIVAYREALALDSNFARAHNSLAVVSYWLNNRPLGDRHFDRALALTDRLTERERLTIAADAANWRGRADDAIAGYLRLLERYPDDRNTRGLLGYALLRSGRFKEAIEQYQQLLQADSTNFSAHINLATSLLGVGQASDALPHYASAFALRPQTVTGNPTLAHEYAQVLVDAGFPDRARRLLDPLASGDAFQRASRARSLGLINVKTGFADSALQHFREAEALSLRVGNPTTLVRNRLYVATTLTFMERSNDAIGELARVEPLLKSARIEPTWIAGAAEVAATAGDVSRAKRLAALSASRADSGNSADRVALARAAGEIALLMNDASGALVSAQAAAAESEDARAGNLLARALERNGRSAEALERHRAVIARPAGGGEGAFRHAASWADAARLAMSLGDSVGGRQLASAFLARWPDATRSFPLRQRVARLLGPTRP